MNFDEIAIILKTELSLKRYNHCLCVCEEAEKLAAFYGVDVKKARLAGLMHDCAKAMTNAQHMKLGYEFNFELTDYEKNQPKILHAFIGAYLISKKYNIDDLDIFDAIFYHTTAKPNMSILTKIIFIADFIEPNRPKCTQIANIRELAYSDIDEAVISGIDFTILNLINSGSLIHNLSFEARNYYINKRKSM